MLFPEAIQAFDETLLRVAQGTPRPLVLLLWGMSTIGGGWGLLVLVPFFFRRASRVAVIYLLLCEGAVSGLGQLLKRTVERIRPCDALGWCPSQLGFSPGGYSFPSGHAAGSFLFCAFVATFRPRFAPLLLAFATAVAWSRVVLGVHYPSDVIGGAIFGGLAGWGTATLYLKLHPAEAKASPDAPGAAEPPPPAEAAPEPPPDGEPDPRGAHDEAR